MKKSMSGAEKRLWIDHLLDTYGNFVWRLVDQHSEHGKEAEDAFVYVFTLAIARLDKRVTKLLSNAWFEGLVAETARSTPPVLPNRTDTLEFGYGSDEGSRTDVQADARDLASDDELSAVMYQRTAQMMRARIATDEAMRHHRGTTWTKVGAVSVLVVGICGVGYGVSDKVLARFHASNPTSTTTSQPSWSDVAKNLPVTPLSIYALSPSTTVNLSHFAVGVSGLYRGLLVQSVDSWPEIHIHGYMFAESGKSMSSALTRSFKIELVPPLQQSKKSSSSNGNWQIGNWRLVRLNSTWLIAIVDWHNGTGTGTPTKQIYGLNVSNQQYSLLDTLRPQSGVANRFVVAVGYGRIVIQSAYDDGTGTSVLGRPIEIYAMTGQDPLHAWTQISQIPAPFGLMESPIATKKGIVFQGIAGKSASDSSTASVWHQMSWNGQMTDLQGPPVDGQSHWAAVGQSGSMWWVETTPVASKHQSGYQVSMGELATSASSSTGHVKNLNTSVSQIAVQGASLIWVEDTPGKSRRLVIGQVQ